VENVINDLDIKGSRTFTKHILFIVIDCLRSDHVSLYGYRRNTTPFLNDLHSACVFYEMISPSSWTYPSVTSILTGLYPHNHGGVFSEELRNFNAGMMPQAVKENVVFLPEIFDHLGYLTYLGSAIATAELPVSGRFRYAHISHRARADQIFSQYLKWLKKNKGFLTFAYLHIGDLHARIKLPISYRKLFGGIEKIPRLERWDYLHGVDFRDPAFNRYRDNRIKLYDAAILYVDNQLGKLFHQLKNMDLLGNFLIIITADHGEEFWDHVNLEAKYFYDPRPAFGVAHGHHLWQELIKVPLILVFPEIKGVELKERKSLIDLAPTVLHLLGVKNWEYLNLDGKVLFDDSSERVVLSEDVAFGYEKKALLKGKYKLYFSLGDSITWVFDLSQDFTEQNPMILPDVAKELMKYLPQSKREGLQLSIDEEIRKRLQDLGYF